MAGRANRPMGLFHSEADLRLARENLEREPIRSARAQLETADADPLVAACRSALRGQLHEAPEAGFLAADALNEVDFMLAGGFDLAGVKRALGWLTVAAMLRDHPAWGASWREDIAAGLGRFQEGDDLLREIWLGALTMAAGILLESDQAVARGAAVYRRTVAERIHPEGFFKGIADVANGDDLYEAQTSATCALVLLAKMAETAGQAGLGLWSYESRAVSVFTAVAYTHFYYFFPEKWRWEDDLSRERTAAIMGREGAFMELVNRRAPPPGIEQFLDERRPLFCAYGGGLTTLTHGLPPKKKRRWRLW